MIIKELTIVITVDFRQWATVHFPQGIIAAVHSPLDSSGELDLSVVEKQASRLIELGISGVFVCGTTGECYSLDVEERCRLADRWCQIARGTALKVIVHVGHCTQRTCRVMAQAAAQSGAHGIAAMAPFYHRPETASLLIEFFLPIAKASGLPFYYYDIPHLTYVNLPIVEIIEQGKVRIPGFAGIKYTNSDLMQFQQCVEIAGGGLELLHGFDETLLAGVMLGATGAVGTTYNVACRLYQGMLEAVAKHDWITARTLQQRSVRMIEVLKKFGLLAATKAVMERLGVPCGPPRPPLRPLSPEEKDRLFEKLDRLEVLDPAAL